MQITSYPKYDRLSCHALERTKRNSSFADLMASTVSKSTGNVKTAQVHSSPTWREYGAWRESREPINIPSTDGWTEENIQYLQNRYSGELSLFERIEALSTMANMGCITPEEYQKAVGTDKEMVVCDAHEATCVSGRLEEGRYSSRMLVQTLSEVNWAEALKGLTIGKASTLDDLLNLLDAENKPRISGK